jgi:hypothetical protein
VNAFLTVCQNIHLAGYKGHAVEVLQQARRPVPVSLFIVIMASKARFSSMATSRKRIG